VDADNRLRRGTLWQSEEDTSVGDRTCRQDGDGRTRSFAVLDVAERRSSLTSTQWSRVAFRGRRRSLFRTSCDAFDLSRAWGASLPRGRRGCGRSRPTRSRAKTPAGLTPVPCRTLNRAARTCADSAYGRHREPHLHPPDRIPLRKLPAVFTDSRGGDKRDRQARFLRCSTAAPTIARIHARYGWSAARNGLGGSNIDYHRSSQGLGSLVGATVVYRPTLRRGRTGSHCKKWTRVPRGASGTERVVYAGAARA